ncbi:MULTISPECIES: type II toxin-antitoxin system RelE/ParE family toxin [Photorhabdus]|uniref:Type II toxin-antitoxin system RelE/ParE family toxin n=2 Tax=Photorhabdus asymbiotica TaxID=291112 RepID=C7BSN8_PHOAA|nr:type II toxin-antitoxin system RelE/ParE family toxin [Photorhabdus asymbiotica]RKS66351.1 hypothetical protein BDD30_0645 [Photorhabdus asymbiotica]CAQ83732.1 conserved hypothetical protein [Photorhabdus asymbiotica]
MRIFITDDFAAFIDDHSLTNADLCQSAKEIISGLVDANLGGSLFKKRIALARTGKSGSARSVVAFRHNDKIIFIDGWLKKDVAKSGKEIPDKLLKVYTLWISRCIAAARERIPGSIDNYVTGVSECSQQRGNLKDDGYISY